MARVAAVAADLMLASKVEAMLTASGHDDSAPPKA